MNNFDNAQANASFVCPHCGETIIDTPLRQFQTYEVKVARWLKGQIPAIGEPNFDVWQCEPFPSLTFQVKFSNLGQPKRGVRMNGQKVWTWAQHKLRDGQPDYFVLCGVAEDDRENWFVLPRRAFLEHSGSNGKGGLFMQGNPQQFSRRGQSRRSPGYLHENTIWKYQCADPEKMIEHVLHQEELGQLALL